MLPYPALHASHAGVWIADAEGARAVGRGEAIRCAADTPMIVLNAPLVGQRLGYAELSGLDLLELFAFLKPATFLPPTPRGLARMVGLTPPEDEASIASFLRDAAAALLTIPASDWPEREGAWTAAQSLGRLRWPWAPP
ncbi:MAG: ATP-dependent DNA helicase, partial [Sphingomonas sp.]